MKHSKKTTMKKGELIELSEGLRIFCLLIIFVFWLLAMTGITDWPLLFFIGKPIEFICGAVRL